MILLLLGYLAYTGVQDSKSYYVTIKELHKMGDGAYSKRLRVAGNVQPGSIHRAEPMCSLCWSRKTRTSRSITPVSKPLQIPSKTIPRLWPMAASGATAFFTPSNCRQSALPSTLHSSRELRAERRLQPPAKSVTQVQTPSSSRSRVVQAAPSVESSQTGADALWYRL